MNRHAVLAGPKDLRLRSQPLHAPGPGELLIHPEVVGVCGTDLELLAGTMGYLRAGSARYPIVPGHEWTGLVAEVGPGVTGFAVGDRVVGECSVGCGACAACTAGSYHLCPDRTETGILNRPGALATTLVFPARSAHRVPSGVDPLDAALIEPLAVAYRALRRLSPIRSGPLAIVGAGTIGILCALAARAQGMGPILLIERDEARRRFAEYLGFGAAPALDAAGVRPGAAVRDRYDKVVDATGTESGIAAALRTAGDGGRVVVLGLCGRPALPVDLDSLVLRDLTVIGSLGSPGVWPEVIDLVATGQVTPSVIIGHRFTLNDAAEAFAHANGAGATTGKVIVYPQRGSHA